MSPPAASKNTPAADPETPEKRAQRVERIKQLIQQASSPHGDGQLAATRACALIRKFGLDVVDPSLVDGLYKEIHTLKVELEAAKVGDFVEPDRFGGFAPVGSGAVRPPHVQASRHSHLYNVGTYNTIPYAPPYSTQQPPSSPMTNPVSCIAKFRGRCLYCKREHDVGASILFLKGTGIWCPSSKACYTMWQARQQMAANFNPFTI